MTLNRVAIFPGSAIMKNREGVREVWLELFNSKTLSSQEEMSSFGSIRKCIPVILGVSQGESKGAENAQGCWAGKAIRVEDAE